MGNQLSGIAPSQILPAENYLADLNSRNTKELEFQRSLGSTRFLKVVMCLSDRGAVVIKIFVIQDSTLRLTEQKKKIKDISIRLFSATNCLPFKRVELTERAAFIIRPYIKNSLYDRISTRPFLSSIEKKWLAFQLLCALNQCHQEKICHGDIKLENILVTSWSWLLLSDFASFKPVLLPEDNPTDFTYYFDTSRRRVCHIAPERFKTVHDDEFIGREVPEIETELTPAMDIFSAGCVLIELFTELQYPFNLMQLLQYRLDSYYPTIVLGNITDQRVRSMVEEMIRKNPAERKSAAAILEQERGKLFPEYFYSFLGPFYKQFAVLPGLIADERIHKINESLSDIIAALEVKECNVNTPESLQGSNDPEESYNESLIIITSTITSCVRSLQYSSSKLLALDLFKILSKYVTNDVILDRILPYIFNLLKDHDNRVRAESLYTLSQCLIQVNAVPRSETNIFLEYILPHLNEVSLDKAVIVRQAEAANIAYIADTALRFVKYCLRHCPNYSPESEIDTLQEVIQQKLAKLFSDSSNVVKRSLIEETLNTLCVFFGKEKAELHDIVPKDELPVRAGKVKKENVEFIIRSPLQSFRQKVNKLSTISIQFKLFTMFLEANDILLSHLITFLNEKKDFHLRLSFYTNITAIASFMGTSCHQILFPLFLQGLSDTEESVIACAVDNMSILTELGIFPDHILQELIKDTVPLLVHPNPWVRHAVIGLIATVSRSIEFIDVLTTIWTLVGPYAKKRILQLDQEVCILSAIKDPIPRGVYDALIKSNDIAQVLAVFQEASSKQTNVRLVPSEEKSQVKQERQCSGPWRNAILNTNEVSKQSKAAMRAAVPAYNSMNEKIYVIAFVLKRLLAAGLTDSMVSLILSMQDHLVKVHRHKKALETLQAPVDSQQLGIITLDSRSVQPSLHKFKLFTNENSLDLSSNLSNSSQSLQKSSSLTMNEEWQTMFGNVTTEEEQRSGASTLTSSRQISSLGASLSSQCFVLDQSNKENTSRFVSSCQRDLEHLLYMKREEIIVSNQSRNFAAASYSENVLPLKWRPKGHLVAHLHEHKGAITKLISLRGTSLYASSSKDGTVKIWDCNKTERTFPVNRSKFTYNQQRGVIGCLSYCSMHESFASASDNGSIHVVRVERQALSTSRQLNKLEDGYATDMNYMEAGSQSVLTYSTSYGKIVGWDLRSPGNAWVIDNSVRKGCITSYAIDGNNNWLACGTSSGYVICWDLRFMLPVSHVRHPCSISVARVKMHPKEPSCVIASMRSNNEVVFWDMETQSRVRTLWASTNPPFSGKPSRAGTPTMDNWFFGLHTGRTESGSTYIFTVGTDGRIRYWDLDSPELSYVVCHPASYSVPLNFSYVSRVIDGTEVIMEKTSHKNSSDAPIKDPDQPPTGHIETITDIIMVNQPQIMIVSSGHDGTIKMWK